MLRKDKKWNHITIFNLKKENAEQEGRERRRRERRREGEGERKKMNGKRKTKKRESFISLFDRSVSHTYCSNETSQI